MDFKRSVVGAMLLALVSLNCFKEPLAPVAPTWDTNVTVPLVNRVYTVSEIIARDTTLLKAGSGSRISVSKSVDVAPTYVKDKLTLSPRDTAVQMRFGAFTIESPDQVLPIDISWIPKGTYAPIPDTVMVFNDLAAQIPVFERITLKSGTIALKVENNLPVPMQIQTPIRLLDLNGNTVATFAFSPSTIPAYGNRTATDDLASKTLTSDYRITGLQFYTPGSPTPVPIPNDDLLVATLSTQNLKASRAELADIPSQQLANGDSAKFRLDDSTRVREMMLRSGSLRFAFVSNIPLAMTFKFRFTEMQRRVGSSYIPYEDSLYLAPNGSGSMILNLANTRIVSPTGNLLDALNVISTVNVPASSGANVTISESDKVSITVTTASPIVVDSAVAVLKPTWVNLDTKIGFNLGAVGQKYSGQLNLPAATLSFKSISSIGFPADLYVRFGARKNAQGDSVYLNIPVSQRRLSPGQDAIQFDPAEVGQFFSQITGKLPDSLRIVGKMLVNPPDVYSPGGTVGTVGYNSAISGSMNVDVPMTLGIVSGVVRDTIALGDTTGDGRKDLTIDQTKRYSNGKFYIEIENGLPVGVALKVALMNRSRQSLLSIPKTGDMLNYAPAYIDGSGNVVAAAKGRTVIELTQADVDQYNPSEFISYVVQLNTPGGGAPVNFRTSDNVRIRLWSHLSVRVN